MTTAKVAYILSSGHSGSTIFGRVLGELDGWFDAGELRLIWRMGLKEGRKCGCGQPLLACDVWSRVVGLVFDERGIGVEDVLRWQSEVMRVGNTRRLLTVTSLPSGWEALDNYAEVMSRLYEAIAETTDMTVIVDSSKREDSAALLRLLPNVERYVIHLVRDPRGVVYSWHRRTGSDGNGSVVGRDHRLWGASARGWTARNMRASLVRRSDPQHWMFVRYEDFVAQPRATIDDVREFVGQGPTALPFIDERTASLGVSHTAGGNENRFQAGSVALKEDVAWLTQLPRSSRALATCLTLPLLHRYGYPIFPVRSRARGGER